MIFENNSIYLLIGHVGSALRHGLFSGCRELGLLSSRGA